MRKASNKQIKLLRKLNQKKYREEYSLFIIEGERGVEQAISNKSLVIRHIFIVAAKYDRFGGLYPDAFVVEGTVFQEVAGTDTPQGIMAVCEMPTSESLPEIINKSGVILAIDRIQDPGNMGTIIRTASWFGIKAFILEKGTVDVYNPKIVRSTVGSIGELSIITGDLGEILDELENSGWHSAFLDGNEGAIPINEFNKPDKLIITVGNEAQGVNTNLFAQNRSRLKIQHPGKSTPVESLNAAIAVGIALYALT